MQTEGTIVIYLFIFISLQESENIRIKHDFILKYSKASVNAKGCNGFYIKILLHSPQMLQLIVTVTYKNWYEILRHTVSHKNSTYMQQFKYNVIK